MDTLAALALATEKPHPEIIKTPPTRKGDRIMTPYIWRQIYGMSLFIIICSFLNITFGKLYYDLDYSVSDSKFDSDRNPTDKGIHYTIIFNIFVWMTIFNEFNCRLIHPKKLNIFEHITSNWNFLIVIGIIILVQLIIVEYGGFAFQTASLTT